MIELEALNWSFQLLLYIYDMISGMSRADVKTYTLYLTNSKFSLKINSKMSYLLYIPNTVPKKYTFTIKLSYIILIPFFQ